ncbi:MAG TPA: hypothetical protein VGK92_07425 [Gaiellales bacterium]
MIAHVARGLLLLMLLPAAAFAMDGAPDPAFDHGHVATFAPARFTSPADARVDAAGRILVAATLDDGLQLHSRAAVLRLLPNGSLDPAFGVGGIATVEPPAPYRATRAEALAVDTGGRIVLAGEVDDDVPAVMRLLADGAPDAAFGSGGIVVENGVYNGAPAWWQSIAMDGSSVVVAGAASNSPPFGSGLERQVVLARFSDAGAPDPSFASGGFLMLDLSPFALPQTHALAIDEDGRIVLGAYSVSATTVPRDVTAEVVRLTPAGELDATFATAGVAALGVHGAGLRLSLRAGGGVLVTGDWGTGAVALPRFAAARLTPDGRLDRAFGTRGQIASPPGYTGDVMADCAGNLVFSSAHGLERLAPDGRLDSTFAADTLATAQLDATPMVGRLGAVAFAPGGAVVLMGTLLDGTIDTVGRPGTTVARSAIGVLRLQGACPPVDTRPPAVSLHCSAGCRRVRGTALDDPVGRGVRRVLLGVERRAGTACTVWDGRRFRPLACARAAARLVAVALVRGAFRSPPLGAGAWVVRAVAVDRAGNRSPVAVRRVSR